ncbi:MAG: xanthine dehydrogenase family protein molybdopterin-binding subunit [Deltaproteobacteria bacterium]|nr:xanthine dehydrogenase family protein molybdopterin-binding subunit [Deltaproteobacteria bacterium]
MIPTTPTSRRDFLRVGAVLGGGLIIGLRLGGAGRRAEAAGTSEGAPFAPNAFLRIGRDDSITIVVGKSEMGQGVFTSLPLLVAEELEADWKRVRVRAALVDLAYDHTAFGMQMTGGSSSVWSSFDQLRRAGATAREMLVAAAAETWKVSPGECRAEKGFVIHARSRRRLSFGQLADRAARRVPPKDVTLKDPKEFQLIGRPTKRLDSPEKVVGAATFGLDVRRAGLLTAVLARPPVFGARLKGFDGARAAAVPGVKAVVAVDTGVAVAATSFWAARLGRDALSVEWDPGPTTALSTAGLREQFFALAKDPGAVARHDGKAAEALASAAKRLEAVYEVPYLAHAAMEPLNCTVELTPDACEIWTGTQFQTVDRGAAAQVAGLKPEQVQIHTTFLGGGFGRRANPASDFVREAVQVAKAVAAPVKVVWTRDDDTRGGFYRPMSVSALAAGLDAEGRPVAWTHRIVVPSILAGTPFESSMVKDGIDETSVEGAADLPYAVPHVLVDLHSPRPGIPVLWWRSVGHSFTAFAVEGFLDELAHAAGRDPFEYRRSLLAGHPRHRAVLELVADRAGWGKPLGEGRAMGIAVHESFKSFVAQVAEVSVEPKGKVRVHRVVCAVDCGTVVNPLTVEAQMQGAVAFGLTATLYGAITFKEGRVEQSNFHDYRMLRLPEMPRVEVHLVPSREPPGGVGEPGVPPIAPAVANAVFAATGARLRRLPMTPEEVKGALGGEEAPRGPTSSPARPGGRP